MTSQPFCHLVEKLNRYSKESEKLSLKVKDAINGLYEVYTDMPDQCDEKGLMNFSKFKNFLDSFTLEGIELGEHDKSILNNILGRIFNRGGRKSYRQRQRRSHRKQRQSQRRRSRR